MAVNIRFAMEGFAMTSTVRRKIATLAMFSNKFKKPIGMTSSQENIYYEKILKDLLGGKVREVQGILIFLLFFLGYSLF